MLKLFLSKKGLTLASQNSRSILHYSPLTSFSKKRSQVDIEAVIKRRQKDHASIKEANRRIVEALYFPDHTEHKIQEILEQKKREQAEQGLIESEDKILLDREDVKLIEEISSTGVNPEVQQEGYFYPETHDEMSQLIAMTDINDKLLKFYMKYHRISSKKQIIELLNKMEYNLKNEESIKLKDKERHQKKLAYLQSINKNIELRYKTIFLTKAEILDHPGFEFLIKNINFKAQQNIYKPFTVLELYAHLLRFDSRVGGRLDKAYIQVKLKKN